MNDLGMASGWRGPRGAQTEFTGVVGDLNGEGSFTLLLPEPCTQPCQVGRAVPCQGSRSDVGERNGENQPLACAPYFLVEALRASQGLTEEEGGVPTSFPNIRE